MLTMRKLRPETFLYNPEVFAPHVRGPERDTRPCPGREYAIGGPQS